ncbi:hypothetical protein DPMN_113972 [Dreissena polymorpha]|uniref:Uncharacterized protein n=1 Tax=Dreissena polymorpha TaxID=45954 RepID=A0A9D4KJN6_DREPO|nr:hypothetical protein DPMN_113972 [Dreissena polymorpha]
MRADYRALCAAVNTRVNVQDLSGRAGEVWLNAPNAEKCRRPELDYCATLGDTLTLETITAVGKHFRMPTILEGFNKQRTPKSRVCTVRQELCEQVPTRG